MLRVTLDTGALRPVELSRIEAAIEGRDVELAHTSVTDREKGTSYAAPTGAITETAVWGESRWGQSVWGNDESAARFEAILDVVSDGGFPPPGSRGDALSAGHRHQLRDAMILGAHARERRDIFVTNDRKHFIDDGRRELLEALCSTKIMTVDEFLDRLAHDASGGEAPPD